MSRLITAIFLCTLLTSAAIAQTLTGLARVVPEGSAVQDAGDGAAITLNLSQGVPYRVFTVNDPPRLVVDFSEVDFAAVSAADLLDTPGQIEQVRFGAFQPGWSRFVADLAEPMLPDTIGMTVDDASGAAQLSIRLGVVDAAAFNAASGVPAGAFGARGATQTAQSGPRGFTVVLDPGHGGIDPGAERGGLVEKEIALGFARVVQDVLRREGIRVVMTRNEDLFVSLEGRTAIAHREKASVFVSIHADALSQGGARGATVYTLSDKASDAASALLAQRHDRSDILAGVDLTGADDEVTGVLLDLARQETEPRSADLAQAIIKGMDRAGGPMNRKPWRKAGFSVLKSADIPSVLVEIGFLSDERDRKNLSDPVWRGVIAAGLAQAILDWRDTDAARKQLVRQ